MHDWNVIAVVKEHRFKAACQLLEPLGEVRSTWFYNVLAVKVEDVQTFLETLREWMANYPETAEVLSRVGPVQHAFPFESPEEFETAAKDTVAQYVPQLAGRSFHVRMHRRGWKGRMETPAQERLLGDFLFEQLRSTKSPATVTFHDPDVIIAIETLNTRGGAAYWSREDLTRYPFLKLD